MSTDPTFPVRNHLGAWLDEFTFERLDGRLFGTGAGIQRIHKEAAPAERHLLRWGGNNPRPCRDLEGKTLDSFCVPPPRPRAVEEVRVYALDQVAIIVKARAVRRTRPQAPPGLPRGTLPPDTPTDSDGTLLPTIKDLCKELGVTDMFVSHWRDRETRNHDRPQSGLFATNEAALRGARIFPNPYPGPGAPTLIWRFRLDDARRCHRGEESEPPAPKQPKPVRPPADRDGAIKFLRGLKKELPLPSATVRARGAAEGFKPYLLYDVREEAGIEAKTNGEAWFWLRPGQPAPPPAGAGTPNSGRFTADRELHHDRKGTWYPDLAAEEDFGIRAHYLDRWRKHRCRILGRTLNSKRVRRPGNARWEDRWVTHEDDLRQIAAAMGTSPPPQTPAATVDPPEAANGQTAGCAAESPPPCPVWDDEVGELRWGDVCIRTFGRHPADNQRELLDAFRLANWARWIPDPFNDPRKLNQTIAVLNRSLDPRLIRFRGDGSGEGVIWGPTE
jgi:hypothetical protein